jgi:D-alanine-D-alanine ligase
MAPVRVAVIGGGTSCEHDVSTASAASVAAALRGVVGPGGASYDVVGLHIGRDGRWQDDTGVALGSCSAASLAVAVSRLVECGVAFPAVHGRVGEDGTLAALLDLAQVPYVGSGVRGGALGMDKWVTKLVAEALGIATAPGHVLTGPPVRLPFGGPVVVKPVSGGSSHGVSLVREVGDLLPAVTAALALDDRVLVEELVPGREVDVAVLRRPDGTLFAGPPLEVVVEGGGLFDTTLKYDGSADFRLPAQITDVERKELEEAAVALFGALGCGGVARFDFFLTDARAPGGVGVVLNEVNTMPGMTAASQVPLMFAAVGLPYAALLDELVRGALSTAPGCVRARGGRR